VRAQPDIVAIAARKDHEVEVLIWNYHDDDLPATPAAIDLVITGMPDVASRGRLEHFRVDDRHSNAFTAWKEMGSPQAPSASQLELLQNAGQLQLLSTPEWIPIAKGVVHVQFALPRQGLSLVRIAWQ